MELKELRVGNYIILESFTTDFKQVDMVDSVDKKVKCIGEVERSISDCHPIELNRNWLKKMGFQLQFLGMTDHYFRGIFHYYSLDGVIQIRISLDGNYMNDYKTNVRYVHQLQNLYFALTGEEIVI